MKNALLTLLARTNRQTLSAPSPCLIAPAPPVVPLRFPLTPQVPVFSYSYAQEPWQWLFIYQKIGHYYLEWLEWNHEKKDWEEVLKVPFKSLKLAKDMANLIMEDRTWKSTTKQ